MESKSPYNLERLEEVRYRKRKQKREIAERLGVTEGYIGHLFTGRRWNRQMMERLCEDLGISIRSILPKKTA